MFARAWIAACDKGLVASARAVLAAVSAPIGWAFWFAHRIGLGTSFGIRSGIDRAVWADHYPPRRHDQFRRFRDAALRGVSGRADFVRTNKTQKLTPSLRSS